MTAEFLSIEDIAEALNVHRKTIERYLRDGRLKGVKLGNKYRIRRKDFDDFLSSEEPAEDRKCQVIAVTNHKGGVGKTTTCINLGASLGQARYRVLLVDLDPQASLTLHLGFMPDKLDRHINTALQAAAKRVPYDYSRLMLDAGGNVSLLPANLELSQFDFTMNHVLSREHLVKSVIETLKSSFDFIIFDCGPSLSLLTINALTSADWVLVPVEAEFLAVRGINLLMDTIDTVQSTTNSNLRILGILITKYDARGNVTRDMVDSVREVYGKHIHVFRTLIPRALRVVESSVQGASVVLFAPDSPPALAYKQLTQEILVQTGVTEEEVPVAVEESEPMQLPLPANQPPRLRRVRRVAASRS